MQATRLRPLPTECLTELLAQMLREGWSVELEVTGTSMSPLIRSRDVLTVEPVRPRLGDVAARTDAGGRLVVHRVVGRQGSRWLTRGDASAGLDLPADGEQLLGTVRRIVRRGAEVRWGLGPSRVPVALLSRAGLLRSLLWPLRVFARRRARGSEQRGDDVADLGVLAEVQLVEGHAGEERVARTERR
ncbi:MAG: S24/S26 family peptidase [Vicinamibacteria bacterium]|nr:S24/S26 family peptidase [Vicinamibacteria bacterium]